MSQDDQINPLDVPKPLPVGLTEFHAWAERITELAGKFADEDSMKYALANQVIHLAYDKSEVPDRYFVNCLRKAAANQVASQVFYDIKIKQQEAAKAAAEAEATANTQVASDVKKD